MNTQPKVRLHLFFATENSGALILRRAKDKLYNLVFWDRETNSFFEGQWIKNHVQPDYCGLSPDGRHFLYFVTNADGRWAASESDTVISRPPLFTALALFPRGVIWQLGGCFRSNHQYIIEGDMLTDDIIGKAPRLTQIVRGEATRTCCSGLRLLIGQPAPLSRALRDKLFDGLALSHDKAMDLYETVKGVFYRRRGKNLELIRDFTNMDPQFKPAPYSEPEMTQDAPGWHPLDEEHPR
ncbi:MAG: hypothetical protein AAFQ09_02175 [Pseudomonadota bacterium]